MFGGPSTRERGRLARILIPANSLPSKATPLQGAPNPPLRGSLPSCRSLCGRDARAPRWSLCGRDARAPRGSLSRGVVTPPRECSEKSVQRTKSMKLDFTTGRNASTARMVRETSNRPTRWRSNPYALEELAGHWMASKSEVLRRAPVCVRPTSGTSTRERGRPARILIPANSLPSRATPLQGAPNPPLRGSLPSCRSLCGRDARAPRWSLCGRDARAPGGSFFTSRSASTARMVREIGAAHQVANEV